VGGWARWFRSSRERRREELNFSLYLGPKKRKEDSNGPFKPKRERKEKFNLHLIQGEKKEHLLLFADLSQKRRRKESFKRRGREKREGSSCNIFFSNKREKEVFFSSSYTRD